MGKYSFSKETNGVKIVKPDGKTVTTTSKVTLTNDGVSVFIKGDNLDLPGIKPEQIDLIDGVAPASGLVALTVQLNNLLNAAIAGRVEVDNTVLVDGIGLRTEPAAESGDEDASLIALAKLNALQNEELLTMQSEISDSLITGRKASDESFSVTLASDHANLPIDLTPVSNHLGTKDDPAAESDAGSSTVISLIKRIMVTYLAPVLVYIGLGAKAKAASRSIVLATDHEDLPVIIKNKGQAVKSESVPVTIASDQGDLVDITALKAGLGSTADAIADNDLSTTSSVFGFLKLFATQARALVARAPIGQQAKADSRSVVLALDHDRLATAVPDYKARLPMKVASSFADGNAYVALQAFPCTVVQIDNYSDDDIEFTTTISGVQSAPLTILSGGSRYVSAITDASQVSFRRVDRVAIAVTIQAEGVRI